MRRLGAIAAAVLVALALAPAATGPAVAAGNGNGHGRGGNPDKDRTPALDLTVEMVRLDDVASFQCVAAVEHAEGQEVRVESCQAFRGGVLVADPEGGAEEGSRAASARWTGVLPGAGEVTVCISAHALLTTGVVLGNYRCI